MAQVPKIYAPTPAQFIAAMRGMPVSKVASLTASIEESSGDNPSTFETEFTLREDLRRDATANSWRNQNPPRHGAYLAIPTQAFTLLVDQFGGPDTNDYDPDVQMRRVGGIVTKAIKIYETNSKVIHRNPDVTGTELSLRL